MNKNEIMEILNEHYDSELRQTISQSSSPSKLVIDQVSSRVTPAKECSVGPQSSTGVESAVKRMVDMVSDHAAVCDKLSGQETVKQNLAERMFDPDKQLGKQPTFLPKLVFIKECCYVFRPGGAAFSQHSSAETAAFSQHSSAETAPRH